MVQKGRMILSEIWSKNFVINNSIWLFWIWEINKTSSIVFNNLLVLSISALENILFSSFETLLSVINLEKPIIPFIGVRNSWDILEMKAVFSLSLSSAFNFALINSVCCCFLWWYLLIKAISKFLLVLNMKELLFRIFFLYYRKF